MKINKEELLQIIDNIDDKRILRDTLMWLFSFEYNIEMFAFCCFPTYASADFAPFHQEILDIMNTDDDEAVAAPRGHAKSTLVGLIWLVWCVVNKREKYIVYVSQNYSKTVQFLDPIRSELKGNPMLEFIYGIKGFKSAKDENYKDREDCFDILGMRIEAVSFDQNLRGFKFKESRPTLIILDDIEDDQRVLNPELRAKDANKLNKIIIPSLDPIRGKIKFIGTILHLDSLLIKKIRLFGGKIYSACDEDFNNILWSAYWTEERLKKKFYSIGSVAFESEFRNNPIDNTKALIKKEWLVAACDETLSYNEDGKYEFKVQGVDFAFSDRVTADKSAFVGVGKTAENYTILQCFTRQGMSITEQFDYIEYLSGINNYDDNALEENSIRSMSKELKNYNFSYTLFWTAAADGAAKRSYDLEFDNKRHTIGKTAMIKRLATQFENGRIKLPYATEADKTLSHQIIDECSTYALNDGKLVETGIHGDIPIALGYAIERCEMEVFEFIGGAL